MVFNPPSWVPKLPMGMFCQHRDPSVIPRLTDQDPPDSITIGEFMRNEAYGRHPVAKSGNPYTCGLTGKTYSAAEELGGPVVGDLMEVDSEELGAGFSAQGKLKKAKGKPDDDKHQRRIDDIWGERGGQPDQGGKRKRENDEASSAGVQMRDLTEQLLNKLAESGGDSSSAYVQIARESAAARFLVRSKVAVFHPRDATRIRLVDFGREIED